ncbi:hypothetical protein Cni_G12988 [Canna indica]|uniref:Uncharacterized protein n=1 Tax=Canna indica TaxID=4628 RepID=A0AAQ3K8S2_9LILI|nr:hypothetical protein Cni_G12988 [Canna indica]
MSGERRKAAGVSSLATLRLTWSRNHTSASLSVKVASSTPSNTSKMRSHVLRKKKGSRCFLVGNSFVSLHWDVSAASYGSGPTSWRSPMRSSAYCSATCARSS